MPTSSPSRSHKVLFWASFFTLIAAGIGFSVRGAILKDWGTQFGFTQGELGTITGGGLIGFSLAAAGRLIEVPARDTIDAVTVTLRGRREFTRRSGDPLLAMVVEIESVFFHCAKAFLRSQLWDPATWHPEELPSRARIAHAQEAAGTPLADLEQYYGESYRQGLYPTA